MRPYLLVLFLHTASAVLLLATSILGEPMVRAAVRRASSSQELRAFLAIGRSMGPVSSIAATVLLGSGVYLTSVTRFWSLGWVQVATVFWVVNAVVAVAFIRPVVVRLAREVEGTGDRVIGEELDALRWSARWSWSGDVLAANDAAVLFLMVARPGFGGSLAIVLLANAAVALARTAFVGYRRPAPAAPAAVESPVG